MTAFALLFKDMPVPHPHAAYSVVFRDTKEGMLNELLRRSEWKGDRKRKFSNAYLSDLTKAHDDAVNARLKSAGVKAAYKTRRWQPAAWRLQQIRDQHLDSILNTDREFRQRLADSIRADESIKTAKQAQAAFTKGLRERWAKGGAKMRQINDAVAATAKGLAVVSIAKDSGAMVGGKWLKSTRGLRYDFDGPRDSKVEVECQQIIDGEGDGYKGKFVDTHPTPLHLGCRHAWALQTDAVTPEARAALTAWAKGVVPARMRVMPGGMTFKARFAEKVKQPTTFNELMDSVMWLWKARDVSEEARDERGRWTAGSGGGEAGEGVALQYGQRMRWSSSQEQYKTDIKRWKRQWRILWDNIGTEMGYPKGSDPEILLTHDWFHATHPITPQGQETLESNKEKWEELEQERKRLLQGKPIEPYKIYEAFSYKTETKLADVMNRGDLFWRFHHADSPTFNDENAHSVGWGASDLEHKKGEMGYSSLRSAADLHNYFRQKGEPTGAEAGQVLAFVGRVVGIGEDGEPLVIPERVIAAGTWDELRQSLSEIKKAGCESPNGGAFDPQSKDIYKSLTFDDLGNAYWTWTGEYGGLEFEKVSPEGPGVWRTINGRHVYIVGGKQLTGKEAMDAYHAQRSTKEEHKPHVHRVEVGRRTEEYETKKGEKKTREVVEHAHLRGDTGEAVGAAAEERIKALKIPPGWKNVRVNPDANAALQAVGVDEKGRQQAIYSQEHTAQAAAEKWERIKDFHAELPKIRQAVERDLNSPDKKKREAAAVLYLIDKTAFRVGGEKETGAKVKAYGASTLLSSHVKVEGDTVHFDFVGKKGVHQQKSVKDATLARLIRERIKGGGGRLFETNQSAVLDYLHHVDGRHKVHDFRAAHAASIAAEEVANLPTPASAKELAKAKMEVAEKVARWLGNTAQMSLESYIPPVVWFRWEKDFT